MEVIKQTYIVYKEDKEAKDDLEKFVYILIGS